MKKVLDYTQFINELNTYDVNIDMLKENSVVIQYINGEIEDDKIEEHLYNDLENFLSENNIILEKINIKELFTKGKDAILNWFFGLLKTLIDKGKKAFDKVLGVLKSIFGVIKKFTKKHPMLTKVMVILIIIVAIMIVSAQSAMAGTGDPLSPENVQQMTQIIDATIGFMGDEMFKGENTTNIADITSQLLKIKQNMLNVGDADYSGISEQLANTTKAAFNYVNTFSDSDIAEYAKKGVDFVSKYAVTK